MRFQITPLPRQPKKKAEMILIAEYSKKLPFPCLFVSSAKAEYFCILTAAGKNSNLDYFFYCCPLEIYSAQHLQTFLKTSIPPSLHPFLYSTWLWIFL